MFGVNSEPAILRIIGCALGLDKLGAGIDRICFRVIHGGGRGGGSALVDEAGNAGNLAALAALLDGEGQVLVAQRDADLCCLHVVDLLGLLEVVVQQDLDQIVAGLLVGEVTTGLAGGDGGGFQLVNIDAARGTFLILIGTGDTGDKDGIVEQVRLQNVGVALVYVLCVNENAHRLSLLQYICG